VSSSFWTGSGFKNTKPNIPARLGASEVKKATSGAGEKPANASGLSSGGIIGPSMHQNPEAKLFGLVKVYKGREE
jgi:hypothetical protein